LLCWGAKKRQHFGFTADHAFQRLFADFTPERPPLVHLKRYLRRKHPGFRCFSLHRLGNCKRGEGILSGNYKRRKEAQGWDGFGSKKTQQQKIHMYAPLLFRIIVNFRREMTISPLLCWCWRVGLYLSGNDLDSQLQNATSKNRDVRPTPLKNYEGSKIITVHFDFWKASANPNFFLTSCCR